MLLGKQTELGNWAKNAENLTSFHLNASRCSYINMCHKNVKSFYLHASLCCCINMYHTKTLCLLRMSAPQCVAMMFYSLPIKSRNRLDRDVFDTSATHADLVHYNTDAKCWAQYGSTYGCF